MKRLFIFIAFLLVPFFIFSTGTKETSSADNSLNRIIQKGTFVLGLDDSFPPMGFRDENNEIVGFDVDVARQVCNILNVKLVLQPIDWAAKEQELKTFQIDCIWNGFTITEERLKNLTFSDPYLKNAQVLVVNKASSFHTLSDLKGKSIGLQAGSSASDAVEESKEFKAIIKNVIEFKDNLTALMDLEIGGVDAVVMDLLVANDNINRSGKAFRILEETLSSEEYGIGFRKEDVALKDAVQDALNKMDEDGSLKAIAEKWFGADITTVGK